MANKLNAKGEITEVTVRHSPKYFCGNLALSAQNMQRAAIKPNFAQ